MELSKPKPVVLRSPSIQRIGDRLRNRIFLRSALLLTLPFIAGASCKRNCAINDDEKSKYLMEISLIDSLLNRQYCADSVYMRFYSHLPEGKQSALPEKPGKAFITEKIGGKIAIKTENPDARATVSQGQGLEKPFEAYRHSKWLKHRLDFLKACLDLQISATRSELDGKTTWQALLIAAIVAGMTFFFLRLNIFRQDGGMASQGGR